MIATVEQTEELRRGLQPGSIIIVEDNSDDFLIARHHIRKLRITNPIQRITAPEELLDYIAGRGPLGELRDQPVPAMFILDLRLPGATGLDAQAAIRSNLLLREVPIIAISSAEQITALRTAVKFGASAYMTKPFNGVDFARILLKNKIALEIADEF